MSYAEQRHLDALVALEHSYRRKHRADRAAITSPTRIVGKHRRDIA